MTFLKTKVELEPPFNELKRSEALKVEHKLHLFGKQLSSMMQITKFTQIYLHIQQTCKSIE